MNTSAGGKQYSSW